MTTVRWRCWVGALLVAYGLSLGAILACAAADQAVLVDSVPVVVLTWPGLWLGLLLVRRRPGAAGGPALLALVDGPMVVQAVGSWAGSAGSADPWPGAQTAALIDPGVWGFNLAGFVLLCLTFPDGRLPGRWWRAVPWLYLVVAVLVNAVVAVNPSNVAAGGAAAGTWLAGLAPSTWVVLSIAAAALLLAALGGSLASLVLRYRRGSRLVRLQLRWLVLGVGSVPVLLACGWLAQSLGASITVAYTGFMIAMLVLIPVAVTLAILRHDLLDVDRVLAESLSWLLTTLATAAVFAAVVLLVSELGGRGGRAGIVVAAFLAALALLPVHRWILTGVRRVVDRERSGRLTAVRTFVQAVRDGTRQPEEVEALLADTLQDPGLRLLLRAPHAAGFVDLAGNQVDPVTADQTTVLTSGGAEVGLLVLGPSSPRRLRTVEELAREAWLPIEVSRLRLELRGALDDARGSRSRLVEAVAEERRRLERDLHDGAQQQIVSVGMRLRSVQRLLPRDAVPHRELDEAVAALEATVGELRRLAHGIRPSRLDDGLETAIRALVRDSPVPVEVSVDTAPVSEAVATTAYFVVAEAMANTLKHAQARKATVSVAHRGTGLAVELTDDGVGGARPGFGLTALQDRVTALGGRVEISSPPGAGTTIRAEL